MIKINFKNDFIKEYYNNAKTIYILEDYQGQNLDVYRKVSELRKEIIDLFESPLNDKYEDMLGNANWKRNKKRKSDEV